MCGQCGLQPQFRVNQGYIDLHGFQHLIGFLNLFFSGPLLTLLTARGDTPYNGLYGEAPPERGTPFTLQVYERVGISRVEVYERVGKSVI